MDNGPVKAESSTVYFDAKLSQEEVQPYREVLIRLAQGQTRSGDHVKKLIGHNIYCIRGGNRVVRILFTKFEIQGQQGYLILDVLEKHEYHRSKFLQPKILRRYLDEGVNAIEKVVEEQFELQTNFDQSHGTEKKPSKVLWQPVHTYDNNYIILDDNQNNALHSTLPVIIEGAPGSGKTSLSVSLLEQFCSQNKRVLYITQSRNLTRYVKHVFGKSIEHDNPNAHIMYYHELNKNLEADAEPLYTDFLEKQLSRTRNKQHKQLIKKNIQNIYQEFRILSGYNIKQYLDYNIVGKKQCIFKENSQREIVASLYKEWRIYIDQLPKKYAEFHHFKTEEQKKYDMVIVDESQDLSHAQLRYLCSLAKNNNMVFCMDRRQNVTDENPKLIYIKQLLTHDNIPPNHIQLKSCYRCPESIMSFAKEFDDLRIKLDDGKHKKESSMQSVIKTQGHLSWISPSDKKKLDQLKRYENDADVCIVTQPQYVEEAKKHFKSALVFTPLQIKGLECKIVITYKILEDEIYYRINKALDTKSPKSVQGYSAALSSLFVAFTRPRVGLIVIQNRGTHNLRHIVNPLLKHFSDIHAPTIKSKSSSKQRWAELYAELKLKGLDDNANDILKKHFPEFGIDDPKIKAVVEPDELAVEFSQLTIRPGDNSNIRSAQNKELKLNKEIARSVQHKKKNKKRRQKKDSKKTYSRKTAQSKKHIKRNTKARTRKKANNKRDVKSKPLVDISCQFKDSFNNEVSNFRYVSNIPASRSKTLDSNPTIQEGVETTVYTQLMEGAKRGNLDVVKQFIRICALYCSFDLNYKDSIGHTCLDYASLHWQVNIIELLLAQSSLNILYEGNNTIPHKPYIDYFKLERPCVLLEQLLLFGNSKLLIKALSIANKLEEIESCPIEEDPTILDAIDTANIDTIRRLINSANVDLQYGVERNTILHRLARNEDVKFMIITIEYILYNIPCIFITNIYGDTPFMTAIKSGNDLFVNRMIKYAKEKGCLERLLNTKNLLSHTPLHLAFIHLRLKTLRLLLQQDSNYINFLNSEDAEYLLHDIAKYQDDIPKSIFRLFNKHSAESYFREDPYGRTPLVIASIRNKDSAAFRMIRAFEASLRRIKSRDKFMRTMADQLGMLYYSKASSLEAIKDYLQKSQEHVFNGKVVNLKPDVNQRDSQGLSLLENAIIKDDEPCILYLLSLPEIDIYTPGFDGTLPYMEVYNLERRSKVMEWAITKRNEPVLRRIVSLCHARPFEFNVQEQFSDIDIFGYTIFHRLLLTNFSLAMQAAELSDKQPKDYINTPDYLKRYPIHSCLVLGAGALDLFIKQGADPHIRSSRNYTILHIACLSELAPLDVIDYIVSRYPEMILDDDNFDSKSALDCAKSVGNEKTYNYLVGAVNKWLEILKKQNTLMQEDGYDSETQDGELWSILDKDGSPITFSKKAVDIHRAEKSEESSVEDVNEASAHESCCIS